MYKLYPFYTLVLSKLYPFYTSVIIEFYHFYTPVVSELYINIIFSVSRSVTTLCEYFTNGSDDLKNFLHAVWFIPNFVFVRKLKKGIFQRVLGEAGNLKITIIFIYCLLFLKFVTIFLAVLAMLFNFVEAKIQK